MTLRPSPTSQSPRPAPLVIRIAQASTTTSRARTVPARTVPARTAALGLALVILVWAAVSPGAARADGDPGSDVLVYQSLFVTSTAGVSVSTQVALDGLLAQAKRAGVPIRVAIIAHPADLGAVGELWGKP